MNEEARKCVQALQNRIRNGFYWIGNAEFSMPCKGMIHLIESLSAQLDQVTRERDATESNKFQYETGFLKGFEAAYPKWISVKERLPKICELVLVIASGKPKENVKLIDAVIIASYWGDEGWIADAFDGWDKLNVTHWMPLPDPPKEGE